MRRGFTLIELLISIAIAAIIGGAVYFSLNTALDSWGYSSDQLALQKVLSKAMKELTSGTAVEYGLKDSLEITQAGLQHVESIPPWTDDTHTVLDPNYVYTLDRKIKPGTAPPIAELKFPEFDEYKFMPITLVDEKESLRSRLLLAQTAPRGSQLKFTYHPDPHVNPDVLKSVWWDPEEGQIYSQYKDEIKNITENPFGIKITEFEMKFFDNANNRITESEWVDEKDLSRITGIEIYMTAKLGQYKRSLISFVNLRNSPMRSGHLSLKEEMRIAIPDSFTIHTLILNNISGVENEDELELVATPESGKNWRIKVVFTRPGTAAAKILKYTIEHPEGHEVYTGYPRTGVDIGLNLLALDSRGLFDYDDDEDVEDQVLLEGEVMLEVTKMDVAGAGLFVRP